MKKIVALVLTLVLALSLATVAFAAAPTYADARGSATFDATGYSLKNTEGVTKTIPEGATVYFHAAASNKYGDTTVYWPAYYEVVSGGNTSAVALVVSPDMCNLRLLDANNNIVAYLYEGDAMDATAAKALHATKVVSSKVAGKGTDATCGDYAKDTYIIDGTAYVLADSYDNTVVYAMYKNEFIALKAEDTYCKHVFKTDSKVNKTNDVITSVFCSVCETYIPVVKASKIAVTDTQTYYKLNDNTGAQVNTFADYRYAASVQAAGATTTTTAGVSSAKTFDAGVALYAGMALMSVAGSAVVIGKKKEF